MLERIESTPRRVQLAYHASRQDFLLIVSVLLAHIATSLSFWIFAYFAYRLGSDIRKKAMVLGYIPPEIEPTEVPPRTYFILLEEANLGRLKWYFRKRMMQYSTWSFYFVNIIFCPKHKKAKDTFGHRRLQLIHEFSHCNRGELILFVLAVIAAFSIIRASISIYIYQFGASDHLPYFNVILAIFGLFVLWSAARIMRRREFIADYLALQKVGQPYLDYLKLRRDGDAIEITTSEKRWLPALISRLKWHPTWSQRVDFVENSDRLPHKATTNLILTAILAAMVIMQMAQLMLIPRQTYLAIFLFGENPSYFMQPFGFALHFIMILWLCWLVGRSIEALQKWTWVMLTTAYGSGAALAQFALIYTEHLYFGPGTYNRWHFIQPWGTSASWILTNLVLYCIPFFRKAPVWIFAAYSAVAYMWGFASFIYLLTMYEMGQLPRIDPYFMLMYPPAIVVLSIFLSFIVIVPFELFRRIAIWLFHQGQRRLRA